jgi:hypothetical protein
MLDSILYVWVLLPVLIFMARVADVIYAAECFEQKRTPFFDEIRQKA